MGPATPLLTRPLILAVDPVAPLRSLLARALVSAGYHVVTAADGPQALAVLAQFRLLPDLAIVDLRLPGMAGEELAAKLLHGQPGLPLIFLSAYGHEPDSVLPGLLFEKPFSLAVLCQTVGHVLTLGAQLQPFLV